MRERLARWFHMHHAADWHFIPLGHSHSWQQEVCACGHVRQRTNRNPWTTWAPKS